MIKEYFRMCEAPNGNLYNLFTNMHKDLVHFFFLLAFWHFSFYLIITIETSPTFLLKGYLEGRAICISKKIGSKSKIYYKTEKKNLIIFLKILTLLLHFRKRKMYC